MLLVTQVSTHPIVLLCASEGDDRLVPGEGLQAKANSSNDPIESP